MSDAACCDVSLIVVARVTHAFAVVAYRTRRLYLCYTPSVGLFWAATQLREKQLVSTEWQ